ncbi:MAG: hypothetical protein JWO36_1525 [Myxococcales bacterium]|nr:hypothetical protein [Myxococcales bacterium]
MKHRIDWFVVVTAIVFAVSCSGGGCGGCASFEPIPGGFPAAKRNPNAVQVRVTQSGLAAVSADPAQVIGPLVGNAVNGVIKFPVPGSCGGTPEICCVNGQVVANCGPIDIDLVKRMTDPARLVLAPQQNQGVLKLTIRARVKTETDIPINIGSTHCKLHVDTTADNTSGPDLKIDTDIQFTQDATSGTTRIGAANTAVTQLDSGDYSISPVDPFADFLCYGGSFIPASTITGQLKAPLEDAINNATCKGCPSGDVAECGSSFATSCTNKVCTIGAGSGARCLQELGLDGRARGNKLFSFSPGTTGAIDIYEVAGGYGTTNNTGVALGLLGGMEPGGTPRDQCGPPTTEPAPTTITPSLFFQGNTVNLGAGAKPFDVGIGVHKSQLDQFAFAGYNGGLLCLTIGHATVAQLTTDTIGLISRSLGKLVEGSAPVAVGLRPQSPPVITLGPNTFMTDGMGNKVVDMPLLDIKFNKMEIDFFTAVDEQYIRVFTVVADVHLPVGLQVTGMGTIAPVIGNPNDAFTNISVKNSEAVTETPADLAALFPTILSLALPQLSGGLSPISLPNLGGLALNVTDITSVDNNSYLAIFANLVPVTMPRPVTTTVEITGITEPSDEIARDAKRWHDATPPALTLALGGNQPNLEWSYRLDDGTWSAWSTNARPTIAPRTFWLPGMHHIQVRAQVKDHPETIDTDPVLLEIPIGAAASDASTAERLGPAPFHGQAGATGCGCQTGGAGGAAPFAILFVIMLGGVGRKRLPAPSISGLGRRVRRCVRTMARLGPLVWLVAIALLPGCSCGSHPCGDHDCMAGEVTRGAVGRWTSIAGDDKRVLVATYDQVLGDLVVVDATDQANLTYNAVDGFPTDVAPIYDPSTYRHGQPDPGANVGAWTSIALDDHLGRIAYQDRDALALKYAHEDAGGNWQSYVLDDTANVTVGLYASLVIDADHHPAIAYLAVGIDDGMSHRNTELRLVRASQPDPQSASEWTATPAKIASAPGSCAGACGSQACIAGATAADPQVCITPTSDCTAACASTDVCHAGACVAKIPDPTVAVIPGGSGLYVSLVVLPDGRLAAAYYDNVRHALILGVETAKGSSQFMETVLDGNVAGADRGMWASAVVGGDGTIHIAYQDALGDQLMYTTWNGNPGVPEVVDDGLRTGDRTHPVGAAASIYLVSGSPSIAYQDALNADVMLATRGGTTWTKMDLTSGPLLDGFSIAATTGHGTPVLAWDSLDPAQSPPNGLKVQSP